MSMSNKIGQKSVYHKVAYEYTMSEWLTVFETSENCSMHR